MMAAVAPAMKPTDFPLPFRWNLHERSTVETMLRGEPAAAYAGFTDDLLSCCARILAQSHDADLCFVGRSLDSVFDHLSGLLLDTSWRGRVQLLPLSLLRDPERALDTPERRGALRAYLLAQGMDPPELARRERALALVDLVSTGATLGGVVEFLHGGCVEARQDWSATARKLRIVGMTCRTKTSPNTWRWAQHAAWVTRLAPGAVKNVSVPLALYGYLGNDQPKLASSFHPERWGDPRVESPEHGEPHLQALRLAASLFDLGREGTRREAFARELARQPAMKERWLRSLVVELRRGRGT